MDFDTLRKKIFIFLHYYDVTVKIYQVKKSKTCFVLLKENMLSCQHVK